MTKGKQMTFTMETLKTKRTCEFIEWWRLLNIATDKLHAGQQVGFRDARDCYDAGEAPETAAQQLFVSRSRWDGEA